MLETNLSEKSKFNYKQRLVSQFPFLFLVLGEDIILYPNDYAQDHRLNLWNNPNRLNGSLVPSSDGVRQVLDILKIIKLGDPEKRNKEITRLTGIFESAKIYEITTRTSNNSIAELNLMLAKQDVINNYSIKGRANIKMLNETELNEFVALSKKLDLLKSIKVGLRHKINQKETITNAQALLESIGMADIQCSSDVYYQSSKESKLKLWETILSNSHEYFKKINSRAGQLFRISKLQSILKTTSLMSKNNSDVNKLKNTQVLINEIKNILPEINEDVVKQFATNSKTIQELLLSSRGFYKGKNDKQKLSKVDEIFSLLVSDRKFNHITISTNTTKLLLEFILEELKLDYEYMDQKDILQRKQDIHKLILKSPKEVTLAELEYIGVPTIISIRNTLGIFPKLDAIKIQSNIDSINQIYLKISEVKKVLVKANNNYIISKIVKNHGVASDEIEREISKFLKSKMISYSNDQLLDSFLVRNILTVKDTFEEISNTLINIWGYEKSLKITEELLDNDLIFAMEHLHSYAYITGSLADEKFKIEIAQEVHKNEVAKLNRVGAKRYYSERIHNAKHRIELAASDYFVYCINNKAVVS